MSSDSLVRRVAQLEAEVRRLRSRDFVGVMFLDTVIANNTAVELFPTTATDGTLAGLLYVYNASDGDHGLYFFQPAAGSIAVISHGATFSTTSGTASRTNLYVNANKKLFLQNLRGGNRTYRVRVIPTNPNFA